MGFDLIPKAEEEREAQRSTTRSGLAYSTSPHCGEDELHEERFSLNIFSMGKMRERLELAGVAECDIYEYLTGFNDGDFVPADVAHDWGNKLDSWKQSGGLDEEEVGDDELMFNTLDFIVEFREAHLDRFVQWFDQ